MIRYLAAAAVTVLVASAAQAAPDDSLASAILNCAAQQGDAAQLTCYNGLAARLKAGTAPVTASTETLPPPPPPVADKPSDFGKESLPSWGDDSSGHNESVTANVTSVAYNPFGRFTVTLENGQVWQQNPSDDMKVRLRGDGSESVTILRGMLNSFHLYVLGKTGSYVVKRIQ